MAKQKQKQDSQPMSRVALEVNLNPPAGGEVLRLAEALDLVLRYVEVYRTQLYNNLFQAVANRAQEAVPPVWEIDIKMFLRTGQPVDEEHPAEFTYTTLELTPAWLERLKAATPVLVEKKQQPWLL